MKPGQINTLIVTDIAPFGVILNPGEPVVLPHSRTHAHFEPGDKVSVFVYPGRDEQWLASTQTPKLTVGETGLLQVKNITANGAWLDWGIEDDLWLPKSEMLNHMDVGLSYLVTLRLEQNRLYASAKLHRHFSEFNQHFTPMQGVDLLICGQSDLGYKAIINNSHLGLIFKSEVFRPLNIGDQIKGYIKRIRDDNKIDLSLQRQDQQGRDSLADAIIDDLLAHGGVSTLTDKSPAQQISQRFNVSKSAYKKALGNLYKQQRIVIDKHKITLTKQENNHESNG